MDGPFPKPPVCSTQSRERKHDLWWRGNRLLYIQDGLADISLVTGNTKNCKMSCNIGIWYELRDFCLLKCYVFMVLRNKSQRWLGFSLIFVVSTHWNIEQISLPFLSFSEIPTLSYSWSLKKVPLSGGAIMGITRPGSRFSKVPVMFRARSQIFTSKYKEEERRSWLTNCSILFH